MPRQKKFIPMRAISMCLGEEIGSGKEVRLDYDYLVIAPGPLLNFAGTPGLGPEHGFTHSICSLPHAVKTRDAYLALCERMRKGEKVKIVIGTGHPSATCQGAAFEYIVNVHKDLVKKGLREKAEIFWLSNEPALGDFGVNGVQIKRNGHVMRSDEFIRSVFNDHGIRAQVQTGVTKVEDGKIHWQNYEGEEGVTEFDFSMLIPQFKGQPIKYVTGNGTDITSKLNNPAGFFLVDAKYGLPYPELAQTPEAWPEHYNNPIYPNIFSAGIAFAPPGPISKSCGCGLSRLRLGELCLRFRLELCHSHVCNTYMTLPDGTSDRLDNWVPVNRNRYFQNVLLTRETKLETNVSVDLDHG